METVAQLIDDDNRMREAFGDDAKKIQVYRAKFKKISEKTRIGDKEVDENHATLVHVVNKIVKLNGWNWAAFFMPGYWGIYRREPYYG